MRKYLIIATMAIALTAPFATPAAAQALDGRYVGPHKTPSCRFRYLDGKEAFSQDEVRYTIRCAVRRWPVPGGLDQALYIARRESGFNWNADNPTSSASGVYQFVDGTWAGQVRGRADFLRQQELSRSVWNARSNVLVAIRYAHMAGWGPWGG